MARSPIYSPLIFVFLLGLFQAYSAGAQQICFSEPVCHDDQGQLTAFEIPESQRTEFLRGPSSIILEAPLSQCLFMNQRVGLYVTDKRGLPLLWGWGKVQRIDDKEGHQRVIVLADPMITDDILAPTCLGSCAGVLEYLPPANSRTALIDLRTGRNLIPAIPGVESVPFTTLASFPWGRFLQNAKTYVLITESPRVANANLFQLFREFKTRGFKSVMWYYPGASGLAGGLLPAPVPEGIRPTYLKDLESLKSRKARFVFVGLKAEFKPISNLPFPLLTGFFRDDGGKSPRNPYGRRINSARFDFQLGKIPTSTPLVVVDRGGSDIFKYQAAETLKKMGYFDVQVLAGGLLSLQTSGTP